MRRRVRSGENDDAGAAGGAYASSERLSLRPAAVGVGGYGVTARIVRFERREIDVAEAEKLRSVLAAMETAAGCLRARMADLEEWKRSKRSRSRIGRGA